MSNNVYFDRYKEQMERQQFKDNIMYEVQVMVKTAMDQIKQDILSEVKQEIQVQVDLLMDGKKIKGVDIGNLVIDEVVRHIKSSI